MVYWETRLRAVAAVLAEHNLPLVTASGLVLVGMVANMFAVLFWGVLNRPSIVWVFCFAGIASWLFAAGILCLFPPSAASRHSRRR
jgi:hypothetical protein